MPENKRIIRKVETEDDIKKFEEKKAIDAKQSTKEINPMPSNYIPVVLDSLGKLSAPKKLHFRDYSFEDAVDLSDDVLESSKNLKAVVNSFNRMVFEDFDCSQLHISEVIEILFTIQATFYSSTIEKRIYVNPDLDDPQELNDPDNIVNVVIPIGKIDTTTIPDDFKEPFIITDDRMGQKILFRLPRVNDTFIASDYLEEKYAKRRREFSDIRSSLLRIRRIKDIDKKKQILQDLDPIQIKKYEEFIMEYSREMAVIIQGLCLVSVDGKEVNGIDDVIETMPFISDGVWKTFTEVDEYSKFGLVDEVSFYSPEVDDDITRRFQFRYMDFIPDFKQKASGRYTFSFG